MAAGATNMYWAAVEPITNRTFYGLDGRKVPSQYDKVFDVNSDDEPQRSFVEYAGVPTLTLKNENASIIPRNVLQGPVKTHYTLTYAAAVTFSHEAVKDTSNRYAKITKPISAMGKAADVTPEFLTGLYMDRAFNNAFPATADGIELCGAHVLPDGVTTSTNKLATPAALDETALEDVRVALRGILGPEGNIQPMNIEDMVIPSAYEPLARKLSSSAKTLGSANNDPSVVKGTGVQVFDYLGSATRWFVTTNGVSKDAPGLFWDWIEKKTFVSDQVVLMLQKVFIAYFRARFGCGDWRGIFGSAAT